MSTSGRRLLSSLIQSGDVGEFVKLGIEDYLFRDSEVVLFEAIKSHLSKYGKIPAVNTLEQKGFQDVLVDAPEPPKYYLEEVEKRFLRTELKKMVTTAHNLLVDEEEDKAFDLVMGVVSDLHKKSNRKSLIDFREVEDLIKSELVKTKLMGVESGMLFGWPRLDKMTGGLRGGDVCSIVGRPAAGKTFKVLRVAHYNWLTGARPLVISMEMNTTIISQRLAAMETHSNLTHLLKGELSTAATKAMTSKLKALGEKNNPLWIVDGNLSSTVDDVIMLCRQLNPTSVLVDGGYLLKHPNQRLGKFDRISENAELLKQRVSQDLDLPTVVSYQFNREAAKKKKKDATDEAGLEDIYGSDAIGQLSSIVLGLFESDNIETQKRRKVSIIKGRNGESGSFHINWDFQGMDFSQVMEKQDMEGDEDFDPSQYADNSELSYIM